MLFVWKAKEKLSINHSVLALTIRFSIFWNSVPCIPMQTNGWRSWMPSINIRLKKLKVPMKVLKSVSMTLPEHRMKKKACWFQMTLLFLRKISSKRKRKQRRIHSLNLKMIHVLLVWDVSSVNIVLMNCHSYSIYWKVIWVL